MALNNSKLLKRELPIAAGKTETAVITLHYSSFELYDESP